MVLLLPKKSVIIIYTSILTHQTDIRKQTKAVFLYIYKNAPNHKKDLKMSSNSNVYKKKDLVR